MTYREFVGIHIDDFKRSLKSLYHRSQKITIEIYNLDRERKAEKKATCTLKELVFQSACLFTLLAKTADNSAKIAERHRTFFHATIIHLLGNFTKHAIKNRESTHFRGFRCNFYCSIGFFVTALITNNVATISTTPTGRSTYAF